MSSDKGEYIGIKLANEIIKDMDKRSKINVPKGCVNGETYEKWLYDEWLDIDKE